MGVVAMAALSCTPIPEIVLVNWSMEPMHARFQIEPQDDPDDGRAKFFRPKAGRGLLLDLILTRPLVLRSAACGYEYAPLSVDEVRKIGVLYVGPDHMIYMVAKGSHLETLDQVKRYQPAGWPHAPSRTVCR